MTSRRTQLLALLLLAGVFASSISYARFASARASALDARRDLDASRSAVARLTSSSAPGISASAPRLDDLNQRFRAAAFTAGLTDRQLPSVEPRRPMRVEDTGFNQMSVFLGFERLTLQQLVTFLHQLTAADAHCRVRTIELSPPESPGDSALWRADLELSYLIHAPAPPSAAPPAEQTEEDAR